MDGRPSYRELQQRVRELEKEAAALKRSEKEFKDLSWKILTAQEKERTTTARLIHDNVSQTLAAAKLALEGALREADGRLSEECRSSLERSVRILQGVIEESRRIYTSLRPTILDDLGVLAAIRSFCREFQEDYSFIQIDDRIGVKEGEVPDGLKIVIYRLLQEASKNIAKHSKADAGQVSLRRVEGGIELAIKDNGGGFDLREKFRREGVRRGLGLAVMKEQTELSGGAFVVESAQGAGTTIKATWPQCAR